jgi:hypothetical protein
MREWAVVLIAAIALSGCVGSSRLAPSGGYWEPIPDPVNGKVYPCCWYPHGYWRFVAGAKPDVFPQTRGIKIVNKPTGTVPTIHDLFVEPQEQGVPVDSDTGAPASLPNPRWDWMLDRASGSR